MPDPEMRPDLAPFETLAAESDGEGMPRDPENEIRSLVAAYAAAMRDKNEAAVVALCDPGLVRFDIAAPLVTAGGEAVDEAGLAEWFAGWEGPLGFDLRDLEVSAAGNIAFCHALARFAGNRRGAETELWARWTLGLHRQAGQWRITHEHCSAAIDPETGRAQMHLD